MQFGVDLDIEMILTCHLRTVSVKPPIMGCPAFGLHFSKTLSLTLYYPEIL